MDPNATFSCINHSPSQEQTQASQLAVDMAPVVKAIRELNLNTQGYWDANQEALNALVKAIAELKAPIVNVTVPEITAPAVHVTVPDYPTPQIEVFPALTVPELKASVQVTASRYEVALIIILVANLFATFADLGVFSWLGVLFSGGSSH